MPPSITNPLSSNNALQKAKWLLRAEKAGHTGTLDPLATGVLPLCFGAATKFSQAHLDADKTYETTVRLGVQTDTADAEGAVIQTRDVTCSLGQIVEVLDRFTGPIRQVPPMHSALKKDGKALYEYARQGEVVEREAREVTIHDLELLSCWLPGMASDDAAPVPHLRLRVHCSKGTYIRTLGEDIGQALGCGAHLSALRRVRTGDFDVAQCTTLEALEALPEAQRVQADDAAAFAGVGDDGKMHEHRAEGSELRLLFDPRIDGGDVRGRVVAFVICHGPVGVPDHVLDVVEQLQRLQLHDAIHGETRGGVFDLGDVECTSLL